MSRNDSGRAKSSQRTFSLVSVCWNNLEGLQDTLQSIRGQVLRPAEVIVVDGGSTDGTIEWIAAQKDIPGLSFVSEPDNGIYDALNRGIARATGELIMFTNSGDCLAAGDTLLRISDDQERHGWQWAFGPSLRVSRATGATKMHDLAPPRKLRFMAGFGSVPHQSVVMSAALLGEIGSFDMDAGICADQEHLYRAWMKARPNYLPFTVSICDNDGVSSQQEPGHFARHMQQYRMAASRPIARNKWIDNQVSKWAEAADYRRKGARMRTTS